MSQETLARLQSMSLKDLVKNNKEENIEEYINDFLKFMKKIIHNNSNKIKPNHVNIDFKNIINIMKIYQKLCKDTLRLKQ